MFDFLPFVPTIISSAASLIGGQQANSAASDQAVRQMNFQADMSNTAHQREVADLRAAGLNPVLSARGGSGASTPTGASAPIRDVLSPAVNTALAARRQNAEVDLMEAQVGREDSTTALNLRLEEKAKADAAAVAASEAKSKTSALVDMAEYDNRRQVLRNLQREEKLLDQNILSSAYALEGQRNAANVEQTQFGEFMRYVDRALRGTSGSGPVYQPRFNSR